MYHSIVGSAQFLIAGSWLIVWCTCDRELWAVSVDVGCSSAGHRGQHDGKKDVFHIRALNKVYNYLFSCDLPTKFSLAILRHK
jgi:hypothetical protein